MFGPDPHVGRLRGAALNTSARLVALALVLSPAAARGQEPRQPVLELQAGLPAGGRTFVTEAPGVMQFTVANPTAADKEARVVVYYASRPEVQYARDVWVPARATMGVWMPVGPAPESADRSSRELRLLLYERDGGDARRVMPSADDRFRSRPVMYRPRSPTTAVMVDLDGPNALPRDSEAVRFARVARLAIDLPPVVSVVPDGPLPPTAESLDGVDVLAVAGNRLAADPPGRAVVRRWVEHGGTLWVMLDKTDLATVAAVLGDEFDLSAVGPAGLTTVRVGRPGGDTEVRTEEVPVPLARVVASPADQVAAAVDGWPAAFSRRFGRGKVVFTALAGRGWFRPRKVDPNAAQPRPPVAMGKGGPPRTTTGDPLSPDPDTPDLPVPLPQMSLLAGELHPPPEADPLPAEAFRPLLNADIGYEVVGRGTAAAVLGGFVLALAGLGVGLRRGARPELAGWAAPGLAVAAAGVFVGLGERSRLAVPPTAAAVGFADPVPGTGEIATAGLYAVFHPASGPVTLGTRTGGDFTLDTAGLDGQTRRRTQSDTDVWAWDGLSLPAGVRSGAFRGTVAGRVEAVARFGPAGVEGRFDPGPFTEAADAVILTPARDPVPVRVAADGTFAVAAGDGPPPGQYLAGAVLTDAQQRRQAVYRRLLNPTKEVDGKTVDVPLPRHLRNRDLFFVWATPPGLPVTPDAGARVAGTALVTAPLRFEPPPAGTRVVVPRGFVVGRRVTAVGREPLLTTAPFAVETKLRFQVPPSVWPLKVEGATFHLRIRAAGRRVAVGGGGRPLFEGVGPTEAVRVGITDPARLTPDADGGLYLDFSIGKAAEGSDAAWVVESIGLDVVGVTEERR